MTLVKFAHPARYGYRPYVSRYYSRPAAARDENQPDWIPNVDIKENENDIMFMVELPGLEKKNIELSFKDHVLTIHGENKRPEANDGEARFFSERRYGKFERKFRFSVDVLDEKIKASFKNGILTVTVPKAPVPEPVKVEIK